MAVIQTCHVATIRQSTIQTNDEELFCFFSCGRENTKNGMCI